MMTYNDSYLFDTWEAITNREENTTYLIYHRENLETIRTETTMKTFLCVNRG